MIRYVGVNGNIWLGEMLGEVGIIIDYFISFMSGGEWLYFSFNADYDLFSVGTTKGFIIYNSNPVEERFQGK